MKLLVGLAATALFASLATGSAGARVDRPSAPPRCEPRTATLAYRQAVGKAVWSKRDVWGEQLLAQPGGPTYEAARGFLAPILYAQQRQHGLLTPSGAYYLAFSYPRGASGAPAFALHVADGSRIITRRVGGPSLAIRVGARGNEPFGACLSRLTPARLTRGYLPILQTSYVDGSGVRYHQESFTGRVVAVRATVSFVRLTVDARRRRADGVVRLVPSLKGIPVAPRGDRLVSSKGTHLLVSLGGRYRGGGFEFRVPAGSRRVIYAAWLLGPRKADALRAGRTIHERARHDVTVFWDRRLSSGIHFSVPEERVNDAQRALLIQQMGHTWRYSIGNPYEELSFAEALDTSEVMSGYGFHEVAQTILRFSLRRLPVRFTSWRAGERLAAGAYAFQLHRDRAFMDEQVPGLTKALAVLEERQITSGPNKGRLLPERLCSDLFVDVDTLPGQMVAWQGLLAMGRVWSLTGQPKLARRARVVAARLETALRPAVSSAATRLPDGSIFVPAILSQPCRPYDLIPATRDGSYWNLVMPYGLASGFIAPQTPLADGVVRYLLGHGSRLLGVTRADAHIVYLEPEFPDSGLGQVYGLSVSRFLADNDRPDQLVLSLYGQLAIGMTPDTYVSGEAVSVTPIGDTYYRKMYMPPNSGANSTFLETLRLMLVHERRGPTAAPRSLDLAFATPRAWLAPGKSIRVAKAPTSFGAVSFSIARRGNRIEVHVTPPVARAPRALRIRLRLPSGERITSVRLGARRLRFDPSTGTIDLSGRRGSLALVATVARGG